MTYQFTSAPLEMHDVPEHQIDSIAIENIQHVILTLQPTSLVLIYPEILDLFLLLKQAGSFLRPTLKQFRAMKNI